MPVRASAAFKRRAVWRSFLFSVLMLASPALAQVSPPSEGGKGFEDELAAFKKKIAAAKEAVIDNKASSEVPADPLSGAASLLGLAGDLPVKGLTPATQKALDVDAAQAQVDAEVAAQQKAVERQVFEGALKQLMPLTPEQIRELYAKFEEGRAAAEEPITRPDVKTQIETLSLDPGQPPPTVRLSPGYVTTMSILDSTGAPWPVQDISFAGDFEITPPETGGNVLRITSNTAHGVGNMSVRLVDLITPVIFTLSTGVDVVDYRFEARVSRPGPLAKAPLIERGGLDAVAGQDPNLSPFLDGNIPPDAQKMVVRGADPRTAAWRLDGKIYLRTPLALLSPAWDSSAASSDGTVVYTLNDAPVVLLSDQGRMVKAAIAAVDEVMP